ncbi:CPBP family intramembrane glutamic endopeptidase [Hymenobacter sp. CRA2]|uniref:CPBP family intramembrane glutamic endopeptidase n=1 Tax=Hymenobacter sp. CRA2 TaxID=1955620 RepID=UPI0009C43B07|nr:CPBP family intramembrane glutamic endopeptidase [Hymenobacter sp. CRA2]OON69949.1 hypothetical protein B0919_04150 [Hymenobacter sp. CRA2]
MHPSPVRTYLLLAFGISWSLLLGFYAAFRLGWLSNQGLQLLFNLGALGPGLGAVVAARHHYGTAGMQALGRRLALLPWPRRTLVLVLAPLLLLGIGLALYPLPAGRPFSFAVTRAQFHLSTPVTYLMWAAPFLSYAVLEEIGWRGFLLPHLQQRHSALASTAWLTLLWGLWHAPLFLFRLQFSPLITVGFFLSLFVGALLLTAVFNGSGGSVLACMAFHLANNVASAFDQEYLVVVLGAGYVGLALYLLWRYGPASLAPTPRVGNYFARLLPLLRPCAPLPARPPQLRRWAPPSSEPQA